MFWESPVSCGVGLFFCNESEAVVMNAVFDDSDFLVQNFGLWDALFSQVSDPTTQFGSVMFVSACLFCAICSVKFWRNVKASRNQKSEVSLETLAMQLQQLQVDLSKVERHFFVSSDEQAKEINSLLEYFEERSVDIEGQINPDWFCPITRRVMVDPVLSSDGKYFERVALQQWYDSQRGERVALFDSTILLQDPLAIPTNRDMQDNILFGLKEIQQKYSMEKGVE